VGLDDSSVFLCFNELFADMTRVLSVQTTWGWMTHQFFYVLMSSLQIACSICSNHVGMDDLSVFLCFNELFTDITRVASVLTTWDWMTLQFPARRARHGII
jgi:hypothetical protein